MGFIFSAMRMDGVVRGAIALFMRLYFTWIMIVIYITRRLTTLEKEMDAEDKIQASESRS